MLTKENKIRNPFPMIGKVFKYEFISTLRIFGPLYGAMVLLGVVMGFFFLGNVHGADIFVNLEGSPSGGVVEGLFFMLYFMIVMSSWIVTFILLEKRFKKGMLADEAYLNLTLPVTVGEHLWGRTLVALVWILICFVCIFISGFMLSMGIWKEMFTFDWSFFYQRVIEETGHRLISLVFMGLGMIFAFLLLAITFVYVVDTIGSLAKKSHILVEVVAAIALIFIFSQVTRLVGFVPNSQRNVTDWVNVLIVIGIDLCFAVINIVATQLILNFKLNLE